MFSDFQFAWYRFTFQAGREGLKLPPFKGNLFLDYKFMELLRRHICLSGRQECSKGCLAADNCVYAFLYNKVDTGSLKTRNYVPQTPPLAWQAPLEKKTDYAAGEQLYFNLALVGRAVSFLPGLIAALADLGRLGPSTGGNYTLKSVHALCPFSGSRQLVYNYKDGKIDKTEVLVRGTTIEQWAESRLPVQRLAVLFLTPTCIYDAGECQDRPHFSALARALFRRVSTLYYYFHGKKEMEINYMKFLHKAEKIRPVRDYTRFLPARQRGGAYGEAEGLLGEVTYANISAEFLPLLKAGEYLNLGRNSACGLGRYRLKL